MAKYVRFTPLGVSSIITDLFYSVRRAINRQEVQTGNDLILPAAGEAQIDVSATDLVDGEEVLVYVDQYDGTNLLTYKLLGGGSNVIEELPPSRFYYDLTGNSVDFKPNTQVSVLTGQQVSFDFRANSASVGTGYFTDAASGSRGWARLFTGGVVYFNDTALSLLIDGVPATSLETVWPNDGNFHKVTLVALSDFVIDVFCRRSNASNPLSGTIANILTPESLWLVNDQASTLVDSNAINDMTITDYVDDWFEEEVHSTAYKERIAVMGTSFMSQQTQISASHLAYADQGSISWFLDRRRWPFLFEPEHNFAEFGTTIRTIIDTQLPNVLAQHAITPFTYVFMNIGGNDSRGGATLSEMQADADELLNALLAVGITPVVEGLAPRYETPAGYGVNELKTNQDFNTWMQAKGNVIAINVFDALTNGQAGDAGWNTLENLVYDSASSFLHPSSKAAYQMGKLWDQQFPATDKVIEFTLTNADLAPANPYGSILTNPELLGTGSAPTGMYANGGTWTGSDGSWTCQMVPSVTHNFGESVANTGDWVTDSAVEAGDRIFGIAEVEIENGVDIRSLILRMNIAYGDGAVLQVQDNKFNSSDVDAASTVIDNEAGVTRFTLKTPVATVPAWTGTGNTSVVCRVDIVTGAAGAGNVTIKGFEFKHSI